MTTRVASQDEILLVSSTVQKVLGRDSPVTATLPTLRSFLKIVDVPFFTPGTTNPVTPEYIRGVMGQSHMASSFKLANAPRIMRNSRRANTATVWFDMIDSQSGACAKCLIGSFFQFSTVACFVCAACSHPGMPQCQHCWRWGHSTRACCSQAPRCPLCTSLHTEDGHRSLASCCRGNPSANPPQPAILVGTVCPHPPHCVNCNGEHSSKDRQCTFWHHQFDWLWLASKGVGTSGPSGGAGASSRPAGAREHEDRAAFSRRCT